MRRQVAVVAALIVAALALRVPSFFLPLSSDEGGYLLVASQWQPGGSLYGDYWVDRPPLLIALFEVAHHAGGAVPLRVLGCLAVVAVIVLAAHVGRLVAPAVPAAPVFVAAVAAVFLSTPLFGARQVNGELLSVPFTLLGLVAILTGLRASDGRAAGRWWLLAGAAAAAACSVKQSMVDVFVAALVGAIVLATHGRPGRAAVLVASVGSAGVAGLAGIVAWADARGTGATALWDAVVTFRAEASAVIAAAAPAANDSRAVLLVLAFVGSGAAGLFVAARGHDAEGAEGTADPPGFRAITLSVVGWELLAVAAGGSYWLHYLVGTVPGLVLLAAVAVRRRARLRRVVHVSVYGAVVALTSTVVAVASPTATAPMTREERAVASYLRNAAAPGDTGVTAFGSPSVLHVAGLESPYPFLWSLSVRVRDPALARFTRLLRSPERPTWVLVEGRSLATWGVDAARADRVLERRYRLDTVIGDWHVHRAR